ncbi:SMC domain protein [Vulcanisaeta moutnovskia 768-28]|uniref:SMC domain protein n=1 Tax=Vulcanisaeta moutnovskia (strain 768-28) TaxID=985053 RepID=F0QT70_VULM7|nr:SMC family ATPase [Vulcanisaeta moutnovskia]ADY01659.1 SMC domain protein [Vulcanisaeta moutnovskia 768-28]
MITRVEIENFRSIIRGKAVITEGINFIHGPNGSGKTSILEAIAIALYGSEWVRGKYRLGDLVRRGASSAIIRVEYLGIDGHKYLIQRAFSTEKTIESQTYILDEGGRRVAARDREATQFVVKTVGIDMETFSELLYVRQGEIREILRSGRRGEFKLDTLLRLDAIERARQDVVREGFKAVTSIVEGLRGRLEVLERELNSRREELMRLEREVSDSAGVLSNREAELKVIEDELNKLTAREQELERLENEYSELRQRLSMLSEEELKITNELNELRKNLDQLGKLRARASELESVVSKEDELRKKLEELRRRRDDVKARLTLAQGYRQRIEEVNRELSSIDASVKELNNELDRINELKTKAEELRRKLMRRSSIDVEINNVREELARVNAEIEHIELELNLLRGGQVEKCPLCGRPLSRDSAQELVASREARLRELGRRREELMMRLGRLSNEYEELSRLETELRGIEGEVSKERVIKASLEDLRRRRNSLLEELAKISNYNEESLRSELRSIEDELNKLNRELDGLGRAKVELAELRGRLSSIEELERRIRDGEARLLSVRGERTNVEVRIKELEDKVKELGDVRARIRELSSRRDSLMREVGELRGKVNTLRDRIERLRTELMSRDSEIGSVRAGLSKYVGAMDTLSRLQQVLDDVKPTVRKLFLDSVNEELNVMLKELMHKASYAFMEINEDYDVIVKRNDGVVLPIDALSIGERNLVSLMLRYAIARVVMGLIPILILDEPTEHLDEEHRRRVGDWIRSLSNGVRTVIITSHVDALETIADNVIRIGFVNDRGESMFANS